MGNWNYHPIPNEFEFANWIKIIPAIHDSKYYVTKITLFDGNAILSEEFQTKSGESKFTPIAIMGNKS